jgi:hypothetical protein
MARLTPSSRPKKQPREFSRGHEAERGACNRPSHLLLAPPLRNCSLINYGIFGCCRSGVVFSILRAPSPLISPDGDSAPPTGAWPIDGEEFGVTP